MKQGQDQGQGWKCGSLDLAAQLSASAVSADKRHHQTFHLGTQNWSRSDSLLKLPVL